MSSSSRWSQGLRAAISFSAPIVVGWAAGATGAGLIASLGAFTARFGGDRPYLNRGVGLFVVAISLAATITVGKVSAQVPWVGILAVTVVAVAAVWLCNSLAVGPPGAYVFVVTCAAGVGASGSSLASWQIGLLVLAGAAGAWLVQMADAVAGWRRPERTAVTAAGNAVAAYLEKADTQQERAARHRAATALRNAWNVLITYQPLSPPPTSVIHRLRAANHALHVLFTNAMDGRTPKPEDADQARRIAALELAPESVAARDTARVPLNGPPISALLGRALRPGSHIRHVMLRVAIAVPLAGTAATLLGVGHPYWAMASAVLILHQGNDRGRTLRRTGELVLGTWLGLVLGGAILLLHPQGIWLAPLLAALQFSIAMLAPRNYTLAAVFITATALTIASGTHSVDVGGLLLSRGIDILIGCLIATAVYLATAHFQEPARLTDAIARTVEAAATVFPHLATGETAPLPARAARRDLQAAAIELLEAEESTRAGLTQQRLAAERWWPAIAATEQLAYRTIAACWTIEHQTAGADDLFGGQQPDQSAQQLHTIAAAIRAGSPVPTLADPAVFVATEIRALTEALNREP